MAEKAIEFQGQIERVVISNKFDKIAGEYREAKITLVFTDRNQGLQPFRETVASVTDFSKGAVDLRVSRPVLFEREKTEK